MLRILNHVRLQAQNVKCDQLKDIFSVHQVDDDDISDAMFNFATDQRRLKFKVRQFFPNVPEPVETLVPAEQVTFPATMLLYSLPDHCQDNYRELRGKYHDVHPGQVQDKLYIVITPNNGERTVVALSKKYFYCPQELGDIQNDIGDVNIVDLG